MKTHTPTALLALALAFAGPACAQITLYENNDFGGRTLTTTRPLGNLSSQGFNDRASSVVVTRDRWEVCEDANYGGRCLALRQGNYASLSAMGLNDRLSSIRPVSATARIADDRYSPPPVVAQDFRRRGGERLYEARVTAVRAVLATPEQRCWVEREQVGSERGEANVPGAIVGAVIGGILGHQIGGGSGKDIATAGGVLGGAALGANVGRNGQGPTTRDVQRCRDVPGSARPAYWDVTYDFRGQQHHVQMTVEPGATVTVNRDGELRA
jgi:uncharacterized protein YcfJ